MDDTQLTASPALDLAEMEIHSNASCLLIQQTCLDKYPSWLTSSQLHLYNTSCSEESKSIAMLIHDMRLQSACRNAHERSFGVLLNT